MGIKGLTTFIDEHRFLSDNFNLHDTKLVIDGYSLLYHLYTTAELDMKHGGENLVFYGICQLFVTNLRKCCIEPVIIMDGAIDTDGKKFSTMKDRHKDRVRMALSLAKEGHGIVLPFLAVDVFRQVLLDHQVNFAQCDFEADNNISDLANVYRCPVLSNDSDFYVTDLPGGFINLKDFNFKHLHNTSKSDKSSAFLKCKIFHVDKFCKHFKIKKTLLPLLGTLQGNDYVDRFLGKKLKDLINWLAVFDTPEDAIEASLKFQHHQHKGHLRRKIEDSIAMYTVNRTSEFASYFETNEINQEKCQLWQNHDLPLWFVTEFRSGLLPADFLNALLIKKCFMANFIESPHHTSSNKISLPIRQTIYGFIHQDNQSANIIIEEYDREGSAVKCRQVMPSYCSIGIHNIRDLDKAQSKQLLLDCIHLKSDDLQNIKREFHVPMASMIYWIKNAKPNVCWRHILALLLGFFISIAIKKLNEEESVKCSQGGMKDRLGNMMQRFRQMEFKFMAREDNFDVNASNMFAQWQSILKHISHLNTFVSSPLPMFDVSVMYNGPFVHRVYNFFKTFQKPETALEYVDQSNALENEFHVLSFMFSNLIHHSRSDALSQNNVRGIFSAATDSGNKGEDKSQCRYLDKRPKSANKGPKVANQVSTSGSGNRKLGGSQWPSGSKLSEVSNPGFAESNRKSEDGNWRRGRGNNISSSGDGGGASRSDGRRFEGQGFRCGGGNLRGGGGNLRVGGGNLRGGGRGSKDVEKTSGSSESEKGCERRSRGCGRGSGSYERGSGHGGRRSAHGGRGSARGGRGSGYSGRESVNCEKGSEGVRIGSSGGGRGHGGKESGSGKTSVVGAKGGFNSHGGRGSRCNGGSRRGGGDGRAVGHSKDDVEVTLVINDRQLKVSIKKQ